MRSLPQLPPRDRLPSADAAECRGCGVVCQKVIYPSECLAADCPSLYVHEAFGRTYVGCARKIFSTELDLEVLRKAARRRNGFGAVLAARQPLSFCPAGIERNYEDREDPLGCINPEFGELPADEPAIRVIAKR